MRKIVFALATILVLALTIYVIIVGLPFMNVNGYKGINKMSNDLDKKVSEVDKIKDVDYPQKETELNTQTSTLKDKREEYLAKIEAARVKGAKASKVQVEVYELDFIWARVGNYASEVGLELKLDVFPGTEAKTLNDFKLYNLKFTVTGAYTDMVRFIYKLEGDRQLSAQLSDFQIKPYTVTTETEKEDESAKKVVNLSAEFSLKNVPLNHNNIVEDNKSSEAGTDIKDLNPPATQNLPKANESTTDTEINMDEFKIEEKRR